MPNIRSIFLLSFLFTTAQAQLTGDFSRANCITNNESITFRPGDSLLRAVISFHRPHSGFLHYAGDEDPVYCTEYPLCPTSPNVFEDAICSTFDGCVWPMTTSSIGRWAAVHNLVGLDSDNSLHTGPWTVEGSHTAFYGWLFGQPIFTIESSGPVTNCSL